MNAQWGRWVLKCCRGSAGRAAAVDGELSGKALTAPTCELSLEGEIRYWSKGGEQGNGTWCVKDGDRGLNTRVVVKTLLLGTRYTKLDMSARTRFPTTSEKYSVLPGSETSGAFIFLWRGTKNRSLWNFCRSLLECKRLLCSLQLAPKLLVIVPKSSDHQQRTERILLFLRLGPKLPRLSLFTREHLKTFLEAQRWEPKILIDFHLIDIHLIPWRE